MLNIDFQKILCYKTVVDTLIRKEGGLWRSRRIPGIRFWRISSEQPARWPFCGSYPTGRCMGMN